MEKQNASIEDFYDLVRGSFSGNNGVYRVEAILYDGSNPVQIVFESAQGSVEDQSKRLGSLETKTIKQ